MIQTTLIGRLLLGALYTSIAAAILVAAILAIPRNTLDQSKVYLGGEEIKVMVASTDESRAVGLGGRESLEKGEGMLFVFEQPGLYGFWMKDMLFPLDIIWFDEDRRVVDIWENASPDLYPQIYVPQDESLYVLEIAAGFSSKHKIRRGDVLELVSSTRYTNEENGRVK